LIQSHLGYNRFAMKVTVFGATGLLGKSLMREWNVDQVEPLGSKDVDLRGSSQIQDVVARTRPDWIVLAASYTDVDGCESNKDLAFDINCRGAANVARVAKQYKSNLLFLSTDYVFDGNKASPYEINDPHAPQNVYGASKSEAEVEILKILPQACIVRTSWMFGVDGKCFPETILKLASTKSEIDVVTDQRGCPTYTVDLSRAVIDLCRKNAQGIVHVTNAGDCTWFDFAQEIVRKAGLPIKINPTTSDKFLRPAKRPKYSVLSGASLKQYQITMPSWQYALQRYLTERKTM